MNDDDEDDDDDGDDEKSNFDENGLHIILQGLQQPQSPCFQSAIRAN